MRTTPSCLNQARLSAALCSESIFVCGHQTYFLWGPGEKAWDVVVFVSGGILPDGFAEVEIKAAIENSFAMPFYNHLIFLCRLREPGQTKEVIWNKLKYLY